MVRVCQLLIIRVDGQRWTVKYWPTILDHQNPYCQQWTINSCHLTIHIWTTNNLNVGWNYWWSTVDESEPSRVDSPNFNSVDVDDLLSLVKFWPSAVDHLLFFSPNMIQQLTSQILTAQSSWLSNVKAIKIWTPRILTVSFLMANC